MHYVRAIVITVLFSGLFFIPAVTFADNGTRVHAFTDRSQPVRFNDLTFSSGYAWGSLKGDENIEVIPFSVRVGLDINELVGLSGPGTLQIGIEPFLNAIVEPEDGVEAGLNVGFRYLTPLADWVSVYGEISSGPVYFSIDTVEQGDEGFNFISQFGAGLQFEFARNIALNAGYRFRHLSNAGLSDPNDGINTNALITGISFSY